MVTGMQQVLRVTELFRKSARTIDWPSFDALGQVPDTIEEMRSMTSSQRRELLRSSGVPLSAMPLFLRAMETLTTVSMHENVNSDDRPLLHPYRSATDWNPLVKHASVLPPSLILAAEPLSAYLTEIPISNIADSITSTSEATAAATSTSMNALNTAPLFPGLHNQGSTCYLNSILQALFHLGSFHSAIMSIPTESVAEPSSSIPLALQRLFYGMYATKTGTTQTTNELTKSFGWTEQDAFIQHDAHELVRKLIDNMEEAIAKKIKDGSMIPSTSSSPTSPTTAKGAAIAMENQQDSDSGAAVAASCSLSTSRNPNAASGSNGNKIRELFTGTLENYVDVKEVNYRSASNQVFYELQLVVKNHSNIYSSLQALLEPNVLEGRNKYCLERNGQKSYHDAKTGCRFVSFPPVLMLHLTRFDYDPIKDEMGKVTSRYEYYEVLDLSRFTPEINADQCKYQLHAVLVHNGRTANFGHYFCYVKCGDRWVKFNDEQVTYATRAEVFGANFGGFTFNHWGSETAQTKSAYMLIYVRCPPADLLRAPAESEIPEHLKVRYQREIEEKERLEREKREAHLFTKVHFVTQSDLTEHPQLFRHQYPSSLKFPQSRSLRIENTANALETFRQFVTDTLLVNGAHCTFWYIGEEHGQSRLGMVVDQDKLVGDMAKGREICVLVMPPKGEDISVPTERRRSASTTVSLGGTAAANLMSINPQEAPSDPIAAIDDLLANPPAKGTTSTTTTPPEDAHDHHEALACNFIQPIITHHFLYNPNTLKESYFQSIVVPTTSEGGPRTASDLQRFLRKRKEVVPGLVFAHTGEYSVRDVVTDIPATGVHYYWQLRSESPFLKLYPTYQHFQEFLRSRTTVELKSVTPPYTSVCTEFLSLKMPYEYVQRYFALILNEPNFDRIRFSRHNPETNGPFFMKVKKNKNSTLETLMTASKKLSRVLYYEILDKYTLTEIESANPLSFDYFNEHCQYLSTHMILMPPPSDFAQATLLRSCLSEVGVSMDKAPGYHLLDIWRGRIYANYSFDEAKKLDKGFEESAEYRLEPLPKLIVGVPKERQIKVPISHFHMVNNKVTTHGDPFYLFLSLDDTLDDLLARIRQFLNVSEQAIQDWRIRLVAGDKVTSVKSTSLIGEQLEAFLKGKTFSVIETDPMATPFLGLEHAPLPQRRGGPARSTGNDLKLGA